MCPLLALTAIVKDEAHAIARTLESLVGVVDRWVILDTGSTDGTPVRGREILEGAGQADVTVFGEEFVPFAPLLPRRVIDFAATRNRCLDLEAQSWGALFTITLSADEVLEEDPPGALRAFLESRRAAPDGQTPDGAYCVEMRQGNSVWAFPRVLRSDARWRYEGARHEVPVGPDGATGSAAFEGAALVGGTPCIPGVRIVHRESKPERHAARVREDVEVLEVMASDEASPAHLRARAVAYLAQSHEEIAEGYPDAPGSARASHRYAAMGYWRRLSEACTALDGERNKTQVDFADMHYLSLAERLQVYSPEELVGRLKVLAARAPRVPEVRYMLAASELRAQQDARVVLLLATQAAEVARAARERPLVLPTDPRCEWLALRIACAAARELGNVDLVQKFAKKAVGAGGPPEVFREFLTDPSPTVMSSMVTSLVAGPSSGEAGVQVPGSVANRGGA